MKHKTPTITSLAKSVFLAMAVFFLLPSEWLPVHAAEEYQPDSELKDIARQFYPERLEEGRCVDAVRADLDGTGTQNYIVAAYVGNDGVAIRVIRKTGTGYILANDPEMPLDGYECSSLEVKDLGGDGKPAIILNIPPSGSYGRAETWIFRWNGKELSSITPTHPMTETSKSLVSDFAEPEFFDLDLDGQLEIIQPDYPQLHADRSEDADIDSYDVYSSVNGKKLKTLLMFDLHWRPTDWPKKKVAGEIVMVPDTNKTYLMNVINTAGGPGIYGADIYVNSRKVLDYNDFPKSGTKVAFPLHLKKKNMVVLKNISGSDEGKAIVTIEPK